MISYSVDESGIASIIFDDMDSKVNTLSMGIMERLSAYFNKVKEDTSVKCLVIRSAKPHVFIAGADIKEIQKLSTPEETFELVRTGQAIIQQCDDLSVPTIALINGVCLGGGLELALACDYRLACLSDKTSLGCPEVKLGIIPGFGGTQRLPRLIGVVKSLPMILTGKPVKVKKALKIGLVDRCYPEGFESHYLDVFINDILSEKGRKKILAKRKLSFIEWFLQSNIFGRAFVSSSSKRTIRETSKGHYPALLLALRSVMKGIYRSLEDGLELEAKYFSESFKTAIPSYLINLFFSQETQKKAMVSSIKPLPIRQAGVIGAGLMGSGIAWSFSHRQIPVVLKDIKELDVLKGLKSVDSINKQLLKRRRLTKREVNLAKFSVSPTLSYTELKSVDFIVEAVLEKMDVKKGVYSELESLVKPTTIIASNTSSLSIDELAENLDKPERFIGMHFFSPVNRMPLVEIIPSKHTSNETLATTLAIVKKMNKTAVVVKNCPGFLVNRIFLPYVNEAMYCLLDNASIPRVDTVLENFGMPLGPLSLADQVGLDIGVSVLEVLHNAYGERMEVPEFALNALHERQFLGKKSGKGFYLYNGKGKRVNLEVVDLLNAFKLGESLDLSDQDIFERCIFVMINEAARCLDEGIVKSARELDLAMIMGTGFPPFRGGLCCYADSLGIDYIVERLEYFSRLFGSRFEPCELLVKIAQNKGILSNKE
ncbi:MAG: hypothetical protein CL503_01615 [Actinobacteria bacterium]|nr:hypothetical protein [Actinomycetota bacterium]|tara:strand:+ start:4838 stop:6973 length:2136 start_codon:yes stop_codon:yes gene_type:complete